MAKEDTFQQSQPVLLKMGNEVHPLMGSGYENGLKQGRAEVLAACVATLRNLRRLLKDMSVEGDFQTCSLQSAALYKAEKELLALQPAASALEELLEEARRKEGEKVRKEALLDILAFNSGLGCTPQEGYKWLVEALRDTQRLSIEKARAAEDK